MTKIVIDTNIWLKAMDTDFYNGNCDFALHKIIKNPQWHIALDDRKCIKNEYDKNIYKYLTEPRRYEHYWKKLYGEQRVYYTFSKLDKRHKEQLKRRGFHEPEDQIFVGTAMNADKVIVTEDSDYGVHGEPEKQAVATYMQGEMRLQVYSAEEFLKERA
ncbi:MAG: PIN domain-containing protein [Bacteroides fragilis]|nr:PIN domain-containing protein [Bacteroides fragilis]